MVAEALRPAEAAFVAGVSVRDLNRVFDEGLLPADLFANDADGTRRLSLPACPMVSFYFDTADKLTKQQRTKVIRWTAQGERRKRALAILTLHGKIQDEDWSFRDGSVTVDYIQYLSDALGRFRSLAEANAVVTQDLTILGGLPVVAGTRIAVHDLAASAAAGIPEDRILAAYPDLDAGTLRLALAWAEANPARGRPRTPGLGRDGLRVVATGSAPRRRRA